MSTLGSPAPAATLVGALAMEVVAITTPIAASSLFIPAPLINLRDFPLTATRGVQVHWMISRCTAARALPVQARRMN